MDRIFRWSFPRIALIALLLSVTTFATIPVSAESPLRIAGEEIRLTLDEALELALEENLSLRIERYNQRTFDLTVDGSYSIYDTLVQATTTISQNTQPTVDDLQGAAVLTNERLSLNLSASQLTRWGGTLSGFYNSSRAESNSRFNNLNPSFVINSGVQFTQPLLRNLGELVTQRNVLTARIRSDANRDFFEQQVALLIQNVEGSYWELVEARDQETVAQESLELAKELHRRNGIQVDVGTMAALELVQSEATVASRQESIILARARVGNAEDSLRQLLNIDQGRLWDMTVIPETDPMTNLREIDLDEALATAMDNRAELAQQRQSLERLGIDQRFAKNQLKPRLDLTAGYGLAGIGGDRLGQVPVLDPNGNPIIDPVTGFPRTTREVIDNGGYSDAFDQLDSFDFDNWSISLTFGYAIQNRQAKTNLAQAGIAIDIAQTRLATAEQQVSTEVRTAVRQLRSAAQQIESARISSELQRKNLDAEQKRYENGMSTSFRITEIQEQLTQARSREVSTVAGYRRALVEYFRSIGKLLEESNVVLEQVSALED